jgi:hypothetical protein
MRVVIVDDGGTSKNNVKGTRIPPKANKTEQK